MNLLFSDLLRGVVSNIMNLTLVFSLLQPKYSKKVTNFALAAIIIANSIFASLYYAYGNLTSLSRFSLALFAVITLLIRPLFKDSFMQWLFSYITGFNFILSIMIVSYSLSRLMPYPAYANTLLRFIFALILIYLIRRYWQLQYRIMVKRWSSFFLVAVSLFLLLIYYFVGGEDVVQTFQEQAIAMHLLVLVIFAVYLSLFHYIKLISTEKVLQEENISIKNNQALVGLATAAMEERLEFLGKAQVQNSIARHDRRHFNRMLLELLEDDNQEEAIAFLRKAEDVQELSRKKYCENNAINAAITYYLALAQEKDIDYQLDLTIPASLQVDSMELAMVISNLLENAIQACEKLEAGRKQHICFTAKYPGRLIMEIKNPCHRSTSLDEEGYPKTEESCNGLGTKSVLAFTEANQAEVHYQISEGIFRVRLMV